MAPRGAKTCSVFPLLRDWKAHLADPPKVDHLAQKTAHHAGTDEEVRGTQEVHERTTIRRISAKPVVPEIRMSVAVDAGGIWSILRITNGTEVIGCKAAHGHDGRLIRIRPYRSPHDSRASSQLCKASPPLTIAALHQPR